MKLINLQLIVSEETTRGEGVKDDPVRTLFQLWSTGGVLLLEYDMHKGVSIINNLIELTRKSVSPTNIN